MDLFVPFSRMIPALAVALIFLIFPAHGQINTPCTPSLLSVFTPCMSFLTNSTANGTSPTSDCCSSLKNLTGNGMDCLCLIVTGSVPFQIPINRTLAISLPRACNMAGVPVQCKASGSPLPAPGPASLGPTPSPRISPSASPKASVVPEPTPSTSPPESSTTPVLTPSSPTVDTGAPTSTTGSRPVLTPPSAAIPSYSISPSVLLFAIGFLVLKYY
ncbi:non-specific lipid transfer protein GPI-anchored 20 isoform X2 [Ricinus communis]|uniref:non-specific lipid transfer protein GPI-anchored 20 isoform X2 n=1 Tax=Ricinus communis TaxID=3988 RepID=UPI0007725F77|nr:non-specific lipid transfer protein GPI-anchored 20 isoform X2 [Ricinus communis]|eukprot:XP_015573472.1 non-specific lipid-transfer protein-like protein At2g13820 [Ricinus communis]